MRWDSLPDETVVRVTELLGEDATAAEVAPLALVCRRMVGPAREAMVRDVSIRTWPAAQGLLAALKADPRLGARVRSMSVVLDRDAEGRSLLEPLGQIVAMAINLDGLQTLHRGDTAVDEAPGGAEFLAALEAASSLRTVAIVLRDEDAAGNEIDWDTNLSSGDLAHAVRSTVRRMRLYGWLDNPVDHGDPGPFPELRYLDGGGACKILFEAVAKAAPKLQHVLTADTQSLIECLPPTRAAGLLTLLDFEPGDEGFPAAALEPYHMALLTSIQSVSIDVDHFGDEAACATLSATIVHLAISWWRPHNHGVQLIDRIGRARAADSEHIARLETICERRGIELVDRLGSLSELR